MERLSADTITLRPPVQHHPRRPPLRLQPEHSPVVVAGVGGEDHAFDLAELVGDAQIAPGGRRPRRSPFAPLRASREPKQPTVPATPAQIISEPAPPGPAPRA